SDHTESVVTVETLRPGEREPHRFSGGIGLHGIADRAVPAGGSDAEWTVESQGRPLLSWPQAIIGTGERVDQRTDLLGAGGDPPGVDITDHRLSICCCERDRVTVWECGSIPRSVR